MSAPRVKRRIATGASYTVAETAAITGVPLKSINQYLDRELFDLGIAVVGAGVRAVRRDGLLAVRLAHEYADTFSHGARGELLWKAIKTPRAKSVNLDNGKVAATIEAARKVVNAGLTAFRSATSMVLSDPEILSGEPCLKGTRLSAYTVAELLEASGYDELLSAYPDLTNEEIEAARFYVLAKPRRGRPRSVESILEGTRVKPRRTRSIVVE